MASIAASQSSNTRLGQLWQFPLLLLSLGLFGYAAYLFINPKAGPTIAQKIDVARTYIKEMRTQAAIEQLNSLLNKEKLDKMQDGAIHELLAQAIDLHQHENNSAVPVYYQRIIEQSKLAMQDGVKPSADMYRRMAESYEGLHQPEQAIAAYKELDKIDPIRSLHTQRRLIELELSAGDAAAASEGLDRFLSQKTLADSERAWAIGESAHARILQGNYADARKMLLGAVNMKIDSVQKGRLNYWLGYCGLKVGQLDEADRYLRLSRDQLGIGNALDADAAFNLGKIAQRQKHVKEAISFYQDVLTSFPESDVAPMARLGRGVCRIISGDDSAGLSDLRDLVGQMTGGGGGGQAMAQGDPQQNPRDEAIAGLRDASSVLSDRANYQGALQLMALEQQLQPDPPAQFYGRLGSVYEHRADQIAEALAASAESSTTSPSTHSITDDAARAQDAVSAMQTQQQVRDCLDLAGDAYIAYSRGLTLTDDRGYGDALWKGVGLYDRAGDLPRVIASLELFVAQRPDDPQTPAALLKLGRSYQAAGLFDKAIAAFQENQTRYPESLSAVKSAAPLAQAYIAKGAEYFPKAETALLSALRNPAITPEAVEFRQLLQELSELYYRTNRFEDAVVRLQEIVKRYPRDPNMGKVVFLMADSYRKSANLINPGGSPATGPSTTAPSGAAQTASAAIDPLEAAAAKKDRLTRAQQLYDRVIEIYRQNPPTDDSGKLYQRLAHFYRADCAYDLGDYPEAIRLYDTAAFRYQNDPSCLAAYVQIVNAYCAMGRMDEARAANERAKWLLKRMPASAFTDGSFSMPQKYWQQWLQWSSQSAQWNKPGG